MSEREPPVKDAPGGPGQPPPRGTFAPGLYEKSLDCVHCGLCLSSCPTYRETGRETSSPRGRIYLMRGVAEGALPPGELLGEEAFLCLGCRACETACPSGVQYGAMLELAREAVVDHGLQSGARAAVSRVERALLRHVVAHRGRLRLAMNGLRLAQRLRLDRLVAALLPAKLGAAAAMAPRVPAQGERRLPAEWTRATGEARGRVALFTGCVMSEVFAGVHRATAEVLAANGFDVWTPPTQGCCGALQAHAGELRFARTLARHNVRVFAAEGIDAIILNSAGCGAAMRDAEHWLGSEGAALAERVRDVCEWLDDRGWTAPLGPLAGSANWRVCYDDPCHLVHGQRVEAAPRRLLQKIPNLELVPHADPGACCGAAGTYNLTQPDMSKRVLARKLDALEAAKPDVIATGNPGCLMQLAAGAQERRLAARVAHPVELLAEALRAASSV